MKHIIKKIFFITFFCISLGSSCIKRYPGQPLGIRNNSDHWIYCFYPYWYSEDWTNYCYPDTVLPQKRMPQGLITPNHTTTVGEANPNWEKIFSEIPSGKYSVYFFMKKVETQAEWDSVRANNAYYRKDVTHQELINNNYIISYP